MEGLMICIFVIILLVCIIAIFSATVYNKFQEYIIKINEVESMIDNYLRNKYDLINRCIPIIKSNIDSDKLNWNYIYNENILGMGSNNSFRLDIKEVITNLMENINKDALNRIIDVNIIKNSEEESYHALKIAQDLRLNNINTLINSEYNSKFNVILNEDDLKKGIVSIRDNHLEEEIKIDEAEIIDYLLGNI